MVLGYHRIRTFELEPVEPRTLKLGIPCPEIAREYNEHKDAVDQFDKLVLKANYSVEQEVVARRWWVKWYWGMVDAVLANAWILYDIIHSGEEKRLNHMEFLISIQTGLVENPWLPNSVARRISVQSVRVVSRLQPGGHWPVHSPDSRGYCIVCVARHDVTVGTSSRVRSSRSRFYCKCCSNEESKIWLCVEGKDCFQVFHEKSVIPNLKLPAKSHLMHI